MRTIKPLLLLVVTMIIILLAVDISAARVYHRGGHYRGGHYGGGHYRGSVGLYIGGPFWGPSWYYPTPYYYPGYYPYYYPPAVAVPSSPPVYIERDQPADASEEPDVWYYCPDSKTYYPYVRECPGGWQTVPAEPPSELRR